jgi:hypothetical protein
MLIYILLCIICIITFVILQNNFIREPLYNNIKNIKNKIIFIMNKKDLAYKDIQNILNFLENKLKLENILIPNNITYVKNDDTFIFNNIKIVEVSNESNKQVFTSHIISFKFLPIDNNIFTSNQELFGLSGRFDLIDNQVDNQSNNKVDNQLNNQVNNQLNNQINTQINNSHIVKKDNNLNKNIQKNQDLNIENMLNSVPDILHLSSESIIQIDSIIETTENNKILTNFN